MNSKSASTAEEINLLQFYDKQQRGEENGKKGEHQLQNGKYYNMIRLLKSQRDNYNRQSGSCALGG